MTIRTRTATIATIGLTAMTLLNAPAAFAADTDPVQAQVDAALEERPGGVQISANKVSWEDGAVILTIADPVGPQAVGSCATGAFCAFGGTKLTGNKLSFTSCAAHSTKSITVKSLANARSSGNVTAKNASGKALSTVKAGASVATAPAGVVSVSC